jgi:hypothetical protein
MYLTQHIWRKNRLEKGEAGKAVIVGGTRSSFPAKFDFIPDIF